MHGACVGTEFSCNECTVLYCGSKCLGYEAACLIDLLEVDGHMTVGAGEKKARFVIRLPALGVA